MQNRCQAGSGMTTTPLEPGGCAPDHHRPEPAQLPLGQFQVINVQGQVNLQRHGGQADDR
jgi:hypothetical protein